MRYLPISAISISPDRQRQFFDPDRLASLQDSIARLGLLQPLIVTEEGLLVAGERRLKCLSAIHMLGDPLRFNNEIVPVGQVPCVLPSEANPTALFEAELEENTQRHDLSWQEQAEAVRRLAELRREQAANEGLPAPTTADIAEEVTGRRDGAYSEKTRRQLIVSQHLNDREVSKAKNVDDAFKILKRREEMNRNAAAAAAQGTVAVTERHLVLNEDCLDWGWDYLEAGGEPFDIILSDPPYGMDAQDFSDAGGTYAGLHHGYADDQLSWRELMTKFATLSWEITKPKAHLYLFCDIDGFHFLREALRAVGWRVHRTPLVMHKRDANRVPWPLHGPRRSYELVLYAVRGDRPVTAIYSDVFETLGDENLGHAAQKSVAAWANLLKRSAVPGDRILDPFAGSGGLIIAGHEAGCNVTLVEKDPASYGICLKRLESLK